MTWLQDRISGAWPAGSVSCREAGAVALSSIERGSRGRVPIEAPARCVRSPPFLTDAVRFTPTSADGHEHPRACARRRHRRARARRDRLPPGRAGSRAEHAALRSGATRGVVADDDHRALRLSLPRGAGGVDARRRVAYGSGTRRRAPARRLRATGTGHGARRRSVQRVERQRLSVSQRAGALSVAGARRSALAGRNVAPVGRAADGPRIRPPGTPHPAIAQPAAPHSRRAPADQHRSDRRADSALGVGGVCDIRRRAAHGKRPAVRCVAPRVPARVGDRGAAPELRAAEWCGRLRRWQLRLPRRLGILRVARRPAWRLEPPPSGGA